MTFTIFYSFSYEIELTHILIAHMLRVTINPPIWRYID